MTQLSSVCVCGGGLLGGVAYLPRDVVRVRGEQDFAELWGVGVHRVKRLRAAGLRGAAPLLHSETQTTRIYLGDTKLTTIALTSLL